LVADVALDLLVRGLEIIDVVALKWGGEGGRSGVVLLVS